MDNYKSLEIDEGPKSKQSSWCQNQYDKVKGSWFYDVTKVIIIIVVSILGSYLSVSGKIDSSREEIKDLFQQIQMLREGISLVDNSLIQCQNSISNTTKFMSESYSEIILANGFSNDLLNTSKLVNGDLQKMSLDYSKSLIDNKNMIDLLKNEVQITKSVIYSNMSLLIDQFKSSENYNKLLISNLNLNLTSDNNLFKNQMNSDQSTFKIEINNIMYNFSKSLYDLNNIISQKISGCVLTITTSQRIDCGTGQVDSGWSDVDPEFSQILWTGDAGTTRICSSFKITCHKF